MLTTAAVLTAIGIFILCVTSQAIETIRLVLVVRGKKAATWVLGFISSMIMVVTLGAVITQINNSLNAVGYAAGMATGGVLGLVFEKRLAIGHSHLTIISASLGASIAETLRKMGFAVTEVPARGRDGMVTMIWCEILRKDLGFIEKIILDIDSTAFLTIEDIVPIQRGYWRK